jgi:hypothetical protein
MSWDDLMSPVHTCPSILAAEGVNLQEAVQGSLARPLL